MKTIGLDFGTTNTRLSSAGTPWRYPDGENGLLPSALAILPNGKILIGKPAKDRFPIDSPNVILGPKRLLGARYLSGFTRHFREMYDTPIVDEGGEAAFFTRLGVKTPEDICAEIVQHALGTAGVVPGDASIAMTVPVAFGDGRRQALVSMARRLGFERIRLLDEPVATAVAYIGRCNVRRAAVFDLGGGTFDFAVVGYGGNQQTIEVIGAGGDDSLGGDDIDRRIADWIASQVLSKTGWDLKTERTVFARLSAIAEQAKLTLTQRTETTVSLDGIDEAAPVALPTVSLTRDALYDLAFPLIQRMFHICDEVLHNAKTTTRQIDALFMSGSGSLMYGIKGAATQYFGLPARTDIDPAFVVSIGAGIAMARPSLHPILTA
jgi:molecular chaperone DnaK (HSP70)